jgi:hypothetical protein
VKHIAYWIMDREDPLRQSRCVEIHHLAIAPTNPFVTNIDPADGHQFLDRAKAERKAEVEPAARLCTSARRRWRT